MTRLGALVLALALAAPLDARGDAVMPKEQCSRLLAEMKELRLVHDITRDGVMVGPSFFEASYEMKKVVAEGVTCAVIHRGGSFSFDLLDWRTAKPIGSVGMIRGFRLY
jgi:phosphoribosylformimino-5-aminoimidazole carboxamide ribonucleotide (ProFAR) isomerase